MDSKFLVRALIAAAVLALPVAASAEPNPGNYHPNGWNNNGQWQRGGQMQRGGGQAQHTDRDDRGRGDDRNAGNGRGYGRGANGGYNGGANGGYNQRGGSFNGVVSSFSAYSLQLGNGPHVNLHNGTVINPTGTTLQPGMNVQIIGHPNSDGTYEADQINVIGNNGNGGRSYGPYGNTGGNVLGNLLGQLGL